MAGRGSHTGPSTLLPACLRCGAISVEMANAADQFRQAFRIAHLDTPKAAVMSRIPGVMARGFDPPTWARDQVRRALVQLGGVSRAPGSCAWHCIGIEWSIAKWAGGVAGVDRGVIL